MGVVSKTFLLVSKYLVASVFIVIVSVPVVALSQGEAATSTSIIPVEDSAVATTTGALLG